jgi:hypothetical protein
MHNGRLPGSPPCPAHCLWSPRERCRLHPECAVCAPHQVLRRHPRCPGALLVETGLDFDRAWMVVDEHGEMLTQRELPRLALIQPSFKTSELMLRAPGMLALHLRLDTVEAPTRVRVWHDVVKAYDMGALAAQWFSDFLGRKLRLVRFDPEERRLSDPAWAGRSKPKTPSPTATRCWWPMPLRWTN